MKRRLDTTAMGSTSRWRYSRRRAGALPVREAFKLGTVEIDGNTRVAIVLRDTIVIEVAAANDAFERDR